MTRTVSAVVAAAVAQHATKPVYLIRMAWDAESPTPTYLRVATWDANISWNGYTWIASGASVSNLDTSGGVLQLPMGSGDPWLSLVMDQGPLDRAIEIYEHHTSTASPAGSDAEMIFGGYMDEAAITRDGIRISLVEGRRKKGFPPTSIRPPTYNYLLAKGSRLIWGYDIVKAE
jgi:hypothetical protein